MCVFVHKRCYNISNVWSSVKLFDGSSVPKIPDAQPRLMYIWSIHKICHLFPRTLKGFGGTHGQGVHATVNVA